MHPVQKNGFYPQIQYPVIFPSQTFIGNCFGVQSRFTVIFITKRIKGTPTIKLLRQTAVTSVADLQFQFLYLILPLHKSLLGNPPGRRNRTKKSETIVGMKTRRTIPTQRNRQIIFLPVRIIRIKQPGKHGITFSAAPYSRHLGGSR